MKVQKEEDETIRKAIKHWEDQQLITKDQSARLTESYEVEPGNLDAVAKYALIAAISCGLLAFGSLIVDEKWIEQLRKSWGYSEWAVGLLFSIVSVALIYWVKARQANRPEDRASIEIINIGIGLSVAISIAYWMRHFDSLSSQYQLPLLLATLCYFIIAAMLQSKTLWTVMILAATGWWASQTHQWADGDFRFAGMNYPLRMTLFGLLIWISSFVLDRFPRLISFKATTYTAGLILFLTAAWTLSIFGNYDDLERWTSIKQQDFWYWALGFTLLLALLLTLAIKTEQAILRDITLIFFLLNLYTRYFEYFWERTNKGIFFAVLALSFWFVAKKAGEWRSRRRIDEPSSR
ncbi:hypothetical protein CLV98_102287 [Dyadobacter jejuensis]|uniref:Membrane protein DUF2157 n=1 Tax=Dyadobacter jejuensis TaxID=1082580 RepID=A0A316AQI8_9BACT|nr:hypothetical protein [Dyadobacter jejuensis]PWJ59454.1 hypothetical protein CLV98_102287 [Dyadobacter jejuensis]